MSRSSILMVPGGLTGAEDAEGSGVADGVWKSVLGAWVFVTNDCRDSASMTCACNVDASGGRTTTAKVWGSGCGSGDLAKRWDEQVSFYPGG